MFAQRYASRAAFKENTFNSRFELQKIPREISFVKSSSKNFSFLLFSSKKRKKWTEMSIKCTKKYSKCWRLLEEWKNQLNSTSEQGQVPFFVYFWAILVFFYQIGNLNFCPNNFKMAQFSATFSMSWPGNEHKIKVNNPFSFELLKSIIDSSRKWLFHSPKDKNRKFGRRIFCKEKFKKILSSVENAIPANQVIFYTFLKLIWTKAFAWWKRLFCASKFASRRHQKRLSS